MSKFQIEDHGKYVKPKQDRQCYKCNKIITKGTKCFTQSIVIGKNKKPKRIRVWTCVSCPIPKKYPSPYMKEDYSDWYREPIMKSNTRPTSG